MTIKTLFFIDTETTGVDLHNTNLLEVAAVATDFDLNELGSYESAVLYPYNTVTRMRADVVPFVREMHDRTNLWERLSFKSAKTLHEIDADLCQMYREVCGDEPRQAMLAGNSCRLDFNMVEQYLPEFASLLHYSMLDVSGAAIFLANTRGIKRVEKVKDHSAMSDIRETIAEVKHLQKELFG